jgi:ATP-dependent DNA ligase
MYPPAIKPMLCEEYDPSTILFPCYCQVKLNGIRALYHPKLQAFQTRDSKWWNRRLTDRFSKALTAIGLVNDILDGEFYVHGWPLQRIAGAMSVSRSDPSEDTLKVSYCPYDIVNAKPFTSRIESLDVLRFVDIEELKHVCTVKVTSIEELDYNYNSAKALAYEGLIIRNGSAPYIHNRTTALLKRKPDYTTEAKVTGVIEGKGQHIGRLGAFEVESLDGKLRYKVGGGLTIAQREQWWKNPPIGMVITVASKAGVSAGGIPVQAHFEAVRNYE